LFTDGHFTIDFTLDDLMRIKSWQFTIRQFHELIPRSVVAIPVSLTIRREIVFDEMPF
jgi:hypothetical protein